jgi:transcription termination factor Rho
MSVMERGALEDSPLADLHTIASELSIDGYRRLRREKLIDAILERQGGSPGEGDIVAPAEEQDEEDEGAGRSRRRRGRRGGRGRGAGAQAEDDQPEEQQAEEPKPRAVKREETKPDSEPAPEDTVVEGEVELLPNGSAFLRVSPPEPSDEDVYISAAQVKRCELISGDRVAGPRRPPRRSERFASLYRIDVVNGRPAAELADGVRFDELPAA